MLSIDVGKYVVNLYTGEYMPSSDGRKYILLVVTELNKKEKEVRKKSFYVPRESIESAREFLKDESAIDGLMRFADKSKMEFTVSVTYNAIPVLFTKE